MLDPMIIRKIREEERRRQEREQPQIPLYYEPPRREMFEPPEPEREERPTGCVIELEL